MIVITLQTLLYNALNFFLDLSTLRCRLWASVSLEKLAVKDENIHIKRDKGSKSISCSSCIVGYAPYNRKDFTRALREKIKNSATLCLQ